MQTTWKIPRPVVISLILFVSFLLLTIFWVWFGPILADQVISLAKKVPYYIKAIAEVLPVMLKEFAAEHDINITSVVLRLMPLPNRCSGTRGSNPDAVRDYFTGAASP